MGMEDREWKPRHGNEGLGSGMENEGTGMEGMQSDKLPASGRYYLYIESRCFLLFDHHRICQMEVQLWE